MEPLYQVDNFINKEELEGLQEYYTKAVQRGKYITFNNDLCDDPCPGWYIATAPYTPLVKELKERIGKHFNQQKCINGYNSHDIVAHILPHKAEVKPHMDRYYSTPIEGHDPLTKIHDGFCITKMLIYITKPPKGNDFHAYDRKIDVKLGQLTVFNPSDTVHSVDANNDYPDEMSIILVYTRVTKEETKWLENKIKEIKS